MKSSTRSGTRTRTSSRMRRLAAVVSIAAMATGGLVAVATTANANLRAAGPVNPATDFPEFFTDANGLSLEMCLDGEPLCLAAAGDIQPDSEVAEAFYYEASAEAGGVTGSWAVEAAWADGQPIVFHRTQFQADAGVLQPGATYTITDPYGVSTCVGNANVGTRTRCRTESGGLAADFNSSLVGRVDTFLTSTGAPAGFIGDNQTPTTVTGSPTAFNSFQVAGPGIAAQTSDFIVQGKVADGPAASIDMGSIEFGTRAAPVTQNVIFSSYGTESAGVTSAESSDPAFSATPGADCDTVAPGDSCNIAVTYTPVANRGSSGTLTILDSTDAGPRTVDLAGTGADNIRPTVSSRTPPSAAVISRTANVSARFSEAVRGVGRISFTLTNVKNGKKVGAPVTRVGTGNTWVLNPSASLAAGTRFTARLTGGSAAIRDMSNNTLGSSSWSFRTR